jgi:hypothetical protein
MPKHLLLLCFISGLGCVILPPLTKPKVLQPGWYDFSIEGGTINTIRDNGKAWDAGIAGGEPPDAYVEVTIGEQTYRTPIVKNSYQPRWVGSFAALLGSSLEPVEAHIVVWDYDFLSNDDPIGITTIDLNQVVQAGGSLKVGTFGYMVGVSLSARFDGPPASLPTSLSTAP